MSTNVNLTGVFHKNKNVNNPVKSAIDFNSQDMTNVDINSGTVDGISSLTASGDLDIGAHDLRAATLTADGLTSGRVVYAGSNGVLSDDSGFSFGSDILTVAKLTIVTNESITVDITNRY